MLVHLHTFQAHLLASFEDKLLTALSLNKRINQNVANRVGKLYATESLETELNRLKAT